MLPFTTYIIPESVENKTASTGKWLLFVSDVSFSPTQKELIQKIGAAVKANFELDTYTWDQDLNQQASINEFIGNSLQLVISFGITPSTLGLWIDLQTPGIRFLETFSFILTLPIGEVEKNASAKKELWKNMQMFLEMNEKQNE